MVEMRMYRASVEREGLVWYIAIPEIDYATQARTVAEVQVMTREVISIMAEVPPDSFGIDFKWRPPVIERCVAGTGVMRASGR